MSNLQVMVVGNQAKDFSLISIREEWPERLTVCLHNLVLIIGDSIDPAKRDLVAQTVK
jgi:hypothetical protein